MLQAEKILFYLLILFLPTQLGKHFWPDFSIISGIRVDYLSPTIYFTDVLIGLLLIFWLFRRAQTPKRKYANFKILFSAGLIIFLVFNIFLFNNFLNGFYHLLKFFEFLFVGTYIAYHVKTPERLKVVFLLLAVSATFESVLAILQFFKQGSIGGLLYFFGERTFSSSTPGIANASINGELILRSYGTFSHPNILAGFLLCVMILCLGFLKLFKQKQRLIIIACLLLGTAGLILTMSRVAILLWLLAVIFFVFYKNRFINKWKFILIFGLLIITLAITPFGTRLLSTKLTEESIVQREELISSSFQLFANHPIAGIGFGNFLPSLPSVQKSLSPTLYIQPVHNIFLLVLIETGIIGFSFFVFFLIKTYKYLFINAKTHAVFFILLTVVLVLGFFDHYFLTLQQGQLLLAFVLGLCWTSFAHRA